MEAIQLFLIFSISIVGIVFSKIHTGKYSFFVISFRTSTVLASTYALSHIVEPIQFLMPGKILQDMVIILFSAGVLSWWLFWCLSHVLTTKRKPLFGFVSLATTSIVAIFYGLFSLAFYQGPQFQIDTAISYPFMIFSSDTNTTESLLEEITNSTENLDFEDAASNNP